MSVMLFHEPVVSEVCPGPVDHVELLDGEGACHGAAEQGLQLNAQTIHRVELYS